MNAHILNQAEIQAVNTTGFLKEAFLAKPTADVCELITDSEILTAKIRGAKRRKDAPDGNPS